MDYQKILEILPSKLKLSVFTRDKLNSWLKLKNCKKVPKPEMIASIMNDLRKNPKSLEFFCKLYELELAYSPYYTERELHIDTKTRKLLAENDFLKISGYETIHKYGKDIDVPYYDFLSIMDLTPEKIEQIKTEIADNKKIKRKENQALISKKAALTKETNLSIKNSVEETIKEKIKSWSKSGGIYKSNVFQLSLWTLWASRWAKTLQEKARLAIKKAEIYQEESEYFYELKNKAMDILAKTKYATLSFYQPENKDKIKVVLCERHFNEFRELRREGYYEYANEYIADEIQELKKCKSCNVNTVEDYYSLFYLEIKDNDGGDKFSFHMPYDLGADIFPDPSELPRVNHESSDDSWSLFRFGRTLTKEEQIAFSKKTVIKNIQRLISL